MKFSKKINLNDHNIQIRILKALETNKPFGIFKNFYMVRVLRNLKRPNVITSHYIWTYLNLTFDMNRYDKEADAPFYENINGFDDIYVGF